MLRPSPSTSTTLCPRPSMLTLSTRSSKSCASTTATACDRFMLGCTRPVGMAQQCVHSASSASCRVQGQALSYMRPRALAEARTQLRRSVLALEAGLHAVQEGDLRYQVHRSKAGADL